MILTINWFEVNSKLYKTSIKKKLNIASIYLNTWINDNTSTRKWTYKQCFKKQIVQRIEKGGSRLINKVELWVYNYLKYK